MSALALPLLCVLDIFWRRFLWRFPLFSPLLQLLVHFVSPYLPGCLHCPHSWHTDIQVCRICDDPIAWLGLHLNLFLNRLRDDVVGIATEIHDRLANSSTFWIDLLTLARVYARAICKDFIMYPCTLALAICALLQAESSQRSHTSSSRLVLGDVPSVRLLKTIRRCFLK